MSLQEGVVESRKEVKAHGLQAGTSDSLENELHSVPDRLGGFTAPIRYLLSVSSFSFPGLH
jgi:hypothetical protein